MDETRLYQLAVRGALELPNDPFKAIADIDIKDMRPTKLKAADRRKLRDADMAFSAYLLAMYAGAEDG